MDKNLIGPALPPGFTREEPEESPSSNIDDSAATEGENKGKSDPYGPKLPPHLQNQNLVSSTSSSDSVVCDETEDSNDDDDVYGPMPANIKSSSEIQNALEKRALEIKLGYKNTDDKNITEREDWMIELPDVGKNLGLGSRQFRKNQTPDFSDRSSWTDTPGSKKPKPKGDSFKDVEIEKRDKEQQKILEKCSKKRKKEKSLYEMRQDTLKKKKKEEGVVHERKPFNRETDLSVNKFDEAQKKAILKKAQLLDSRFSQGKSKFL